MTMNPAQKQRKKNPTQKISNAIYMQNRTSFGMMLYHNIMSF
jgi:hypothetical protein